MISIFISYASADRKFVDAIQSNLVALGYVVWIDRERVAGGEAWRTRIVEAIENSDVFLLALSSNSVLSRHVLQELNIADGESKPILPVQISDVEIPKAMKLQLAGLQRVALKGDDISNMDVLYKSINRLTGSKIQRE